MKGLIACLGILLFAGNVLAQDNQPVVMPDAARFERFNAITLWNEGINALPPEIAGQPNI